MTHLYGIKNCDTVSKARRWLETQGIDYTFHDFRNDGLEAHTLQHWFDTLGWETVINKRSTTWKGLTPSQRENMDATLAMNIALAQPTLIKRPVLLHNERIQQGFKPTEYADFFHLS